MRVPTLLQDDKVHYNGQPVGVVVADTFEHATAAAMAAKVSYAEAAPALDISKEPKIAPEQVKPLGGERSYERGDVEAGLASAAAHVDHTYTTPLENHNPMEVHNTIAWWDGDKLDALRLDAGHLQRAQHARADVRHPARERARRRRTSPAAASAARAARGRTRCSPRWRRGRSERPVKLVLTRRQMFGPVGGRPMTIQRVTLGAAKDGKLTAVRHTSTSNTSTLENWVEPALESDADALRLPESRDDVRSREAQRRVADVPARARRIDRHVRARERDGRAVVRARHRSRRAAHHELSGATIWRANRPWSSNSMRECYRLGAEKFGWSKRNPKPRSMMEGGRLVGYGVATATYPGAATAGGNDREAHGRRPRLTCAPARRRSAAARTR